jgi:hypothetical protein
LRNKALEQKKIPLNKEFYGPEGKHLFFHPEHAKNKEKNIPFLGDRELDPAKPHSQPGMLQGGPGLLPICICSQVSDPNVSRCKLLFIHLCFYPSVFQIIYLPNKYLWSTYSEAGFVPSPGLI